MQLSKASAGVALSVALLAGCSSSSQGTPSLPNSSSVSPALTQTHQASAELAQGRIDPMKLLELQAEGKLGGPVPRVESQRMRKYLSAHPHPQIKVDHHGGRVVLWVTNTEYSYLLGLNKSYVATKSVNTGDNGCYEPVRSKSTRSETAGWPA